MTTDSALSYHPTESLFLPTNRRFFPFKIPNFHQQLRNYISTADPDRIYVAVDRVIYAIHISTQKRETIAVIPFEPKCLTAGYGWIGVGGSDNGECAFIKIADQAVRVRENTPSLQPAAVDSALPINVEGLRRVNQSWLSSDESDSAREGTGRQLRDVQLHKFGGKIVNAVTIHRLPGDNKGLADEDVMVLSNNDYTVTIYSLTRSKVLKVLHHSECMNYAIISPDSNILAAVGDETRAYFYDITRDFDTTVLTEGGQKLTGWNWDLLRGIEMDIGTRFGIGTRFDDGCCFTVAFSQFSRLCAIGSQSGVITVFDVKTIRDIFHEPNGKNAIICHFNSSRPCCNGGAVRSMAFAPEPWDLLVWLEDKGRAGVADVRQAFVRRQILELEMDDPTLQKVRTEPLIDDSNEIESDRQTDTGSRQEADAAEREIVDSIEGTYDRIGSNLGTHPLRDNLMQGLNERERLIVEFLNTARWTSRLEEGLRARANGNPPPVPRFQGSTDVPNRTSRPTSPFRQSDLLHDLSRENQSIHTGTDRDPELESVNAEAQPSITLSWTSSPSELQSTSLDSDQRASESSSGSSGNENGASNRPHETMGRPSANFDYSNTPEVLVPRLRNHQRSHSSNRQNEEHDDTTEPRQEASRLSSSELRTNVAAERLRRQRQIINEAHNRNNQREQRYRQQLLGFEQTRSPRWIRSILNELPDRSLGVGHRDQDPGSTAGLGWGADGRTLYVATIDGIFEFQVNTRDRKTFPVVGYR
ncbi:hypothetical protein FE257_011180 [Aspergillus nanangensis]|uniref:DUF2415 domain-containing protein n=1 Tax=Aspergillus nanangensis TaxID=2582783 RepID=A0AAD4CHP1_ASPNN|nr:hypothetical protein FE257_011180 [Aspergillus nanangensis]